MVSFQEPHPLTMGQAHTLNCLFTLGYVVPLYLTKYTRSSYAKTNPTRPVFERWRDHPTVIKARLFTATLSTIASCYYVHYLISGWMEQRHVYSSMSPWEASLPRLGFVLVLDRETFLAYFVTPALFLGPLYVRYLGSELPLMDRWTVKENLVNTFFNWQGARNFVVGPITEELVWRSCILAVYHLAGASNTVMIFFSPISFGAAHLHHAWDTLNQFGRSSAALKRALTITLFQFGYTTLFGFHCAYLFLRTSSVFPPIVAHIFCNLMGVPRLLEELAWYQNKKTRIILAYVSGIFAYILMMIYCTLLPSGLFWNSNERGVW